MFSVISKYLSSIAFKLFISFWLFALLSIALTRLISAQLAQESIVMPLHQNDISKLRHIKKRFDNHRQLSIKRFLERTPPFSGETILLKDVITNKVQASERRFLTPLIPYLEKNSFATPVSIQFANARLTGPLEVEVDSKSYQLYLAVRGENPHFQNFVMHLPAWARLIIPILVSMLLAWLISRSLSRPLVKMKAAAAKLGNGELTTRVDAQATDRKDELGELGRSFNQMAEKLQQNITAQQRLLGDVSHELRSPMTRLQMAIGLALQTNKDNNSDLSAHLERCELEVSRLDKMIEDVLSLSRLENILAQLHIEPLNLQKLTSNCIADCQYLANEKHITIEAEKLSAIEIEADKNLVISIITNILTNAVKYSPNNSIINVQLIRLDGNFVSLTVQDNGPGVPEESLAQLFQPFYRVAQARDRQTGGTGLGLAIAQQAVNAHHGDIFAKNNPDGGLTVTVKLPIKQS
ncbi:ATP-binding protein [Thalassotalea ganghwensis]